MIDEKKWLVVGLITSPHGINGKLKVKSLSDFDERFTNPGIRWLQKESEIPQKVELKSGFKQPGKASFIISIKGIINRNQSEKFVNYKILVKTTNLPQLKKEEFHLTELINLEVKIQDNEELKTIGKVINLENEGNNLLVIQLLENQKKVLVPFASEIVPLVDLQNKFITINPPKGLLNL